LVFKVIKMKLSRIFAFFVFVFLFSVSVPYATGGVKIRPSSSVEGGEDGAKCYSNVDGDANGYALLCGVNSQADCSQVEGQGTTLGGNCP